MNVGDPTRDVTEIGYGNSELDDYLRGAAALEGRELRPDPEPETGQFFWSHQYSFAKRGVPALRAVAGTVHPTRAQVLEYKALHGKVSRTPARLIATAFRSYEPRCREFEFLRARQ